MHHPPSRRPGRRLIACVIGLLALAGCQEDEISHAIVPRAAEAEKTRLLGVIYPHGDQTWFFKLSGPESAVGDAAEPFNQFMSSVRFTGKDNPPLTWTLPDGWTQEDGPKPRYATIHLGTKDRPLEMTVTTLGKEAADVLPNVNRWRRQLGLDEVDDAGMKAVAREGKINGDPATFVDMTGAGAVKKAANGPPATAQAWTYAKPEGWTELPADAGPVRREALFQVEDGAQTAEVSVTTLPGPAGGLVDNLARWGKQIDAPPPAVDKLPTITVAGRESPYVDLTGKKGRILGAVVARGDRTWFFKLMGPADLVEKQKPTFEQFLKSVKFNEGPGGEK